MKAIIVEKTGGVENLVMTDVEQPKANTQEVIVKVKAISVNPVDFKVRSYEEILTMIYGAERPAVLGWDIAGTVVGLGEGVSQFEVGDAVFGMVNFPGAGKAYAEYVAAPVDHLAKMPGTVSFEQAAASTLAALTALQILQKHVTSGDRVLIHAGSGGVGHFAIQIARHLGAHVISTSSAKNRDFVLSLGANEHINYREQAFEEVLSDLDFVLDSFNGEVLLNSVKVVKDGGTIVSIPSPEFSKEVTDLARARNINLSFVMVQSDGQDMNTLKELLEKGIVKAHVSKTFVFEEMAKAHLELESGRAVGKVVVQV